MGRSSAAPLRKDLEAEDYSGRDAEIVLGLGVVGAFVEAGEEIVELDGADGEVAADADVHATAYGHGEGIVGRIGSGDAGAGVGHTEQYLSKRSYALIVTIADARAEEIGRERAVHAAIENIPVVIGAEIGDAAEPVGGVVGDRSTAAVGAKAVGARGAGIETQIRISGEDIYFRVVLCVSNAAEKS
jgi:hypothetical protein